MTVLKVPFVTRHVPYWNARLIGVFTLAFWGHISLTNAAIPDIIENKICYLGDATPACTTHVLSCFRKEISIMSVEYAYTRDCTCTGKNCEQCLSFGRYKPLESTALCPKEYYADDYWNAVTKCSKYNACFFPVPSHRHHNECSSKTAFSYIRYRCVDDRDQVDMCGGDIHFNTSASIFFSGEDSLRVNRRCQCTVTGSNYVPRDSYTVTAMDVRTKDTLSGGGAQFVLLSPNQNVTVAGQTLPANTHLLSTSASCSAKIYIDTWPSTIPERIWILITSIGTAELHVFCQSLARPKRTRTGTSQPEVSCDGNTQPYTTQSTSNISSMDSPSGTTSEKMLMMGGMFVAGLGTSAVILCLIALLVYVLIIKRRYDIMLKKQDSLAIDHPTYAGLSKRDNTYDVINSGLVHTDRPPADNQNI